MALPLTPPSTAPTSPLTAKSNDENTIDLEKGIPQAEYAHNETKGDCKSSHAATVQEGSIDGTLHGRLKSYLQKVSISTTLPHIPWRRRKIDGREKLVQRIDDHPEGYPQLAAFVNSDNNFMMCRRFGFLHARVLLYKQDEIAQLERKLVAMDDEDVDLAPAALRSRKFDDERTEEPSRKSLINTIDEKLKDYDDLVLRIRTFSTLKQASTRDYNSVAGWIHDNKPLSREETEFVKRREDCVAIADGQEGGWFDGFIEDLLSCLPRRVCTKLFSDPEQRKKTDDEDVQLYSKYRIDILVRLALTILAVIILIAPTVVLYVASGSHASKIVIILVFTMLFSAALSVFTKAKRHEMFAATAA